MSAKGPEKKSHPRGKPLQSRFPKCHELFEEPHHCKAEGNSLMAKAASIWDSSQSETCPPRTLWVVSERGPPHLVMSDLLKKVPLCPCVVICAASERAFPGQQHGCGGSVPGTTGRRRPLGGSCSRPDAHTDTFSFTIEFLQSIAFIMLRRQPSSHFLCYGYSCQHLLA